MPHDALAAEPTSLNGAGFTVADPQAETDDAAVARLAALPVLEYERVRTVEAERMGVRAGIFDKLVDAARMPCQQHRISVRRVGKVDSHSCDHHCAKREGRRC